MVPRLFFFLFFLQLVSVYELTVKSTVEETPYYIEQLSNLQA